ncbi:hypothetical protein BDR03DRAFT_986077 [Suillus americanus]|nr:hypothetical protein BDR03DRAFT_986077 [Suillus americanus]
MKSACLRIALTWRLKKRSGVAGGTRSRFYIATTKDKGIVLALTADEAIQGRKAAATHDKFVEQLHTLKEVAALQGQTRPAEALDAEMGEEVAGNESGEEEIDHPEKRQVRARKVKVPAVVESEEESEDGMVVHEMRCERCEKKDVECYGPEGMGCTRCKTSKQACSYLHLVCATAKFPHLLWSFPADPLQVQSIGSGWVVGLKALSLFQMAKVHRRTRSLRRQNLWFSWLALFLMVPDAWEHGRWVWIIRCFLVYIRFGYEKVLRKISLVEAQGKMKDILCSEGGAFWVYRHIGILSAMLECEGRCF